MAVKVKGLKEVRKNLKAFNDRVVNDKTGRAVYQILSTGMAVALTKTPVDTGELTDSAYAPVFFRSNGRTVGAVGFTAPYALFVHEAKGVLKGKPRSKRKGRPTGNYWGPNAEPKFLERAFNEIKPDVIRIIEGAYRV